VELAVCLPLILLFFAGLLEVSRIADIQQVAANAVREAARDASLGQMTLGAGSGTWPASAASLQSNPNICIASQTLNYLQNAEPLGKAFGQGLTTSIATASSSLIPSGYTGYTVSLSSGQELFTIFFYDVTTPSVTDPTGCAELDHYRMGLQIPYSLVSLSPMASITGAVRLNTVMDWRSMVDGPFNIPPSLPGQ
jgi:hypothetical protein